MTWLDLQDVFGLLPMRFDLRRLPYYRQRPLLVLPKVWDFTLPPGGEGQTGGGQESPGAGQDEFAYLRPFRAGDHLSRVHWAATAKTRALFARQYEDPAGGAALIWLDCRTLDDANADRLAECAATLARAHLKRGDSVLLAAGDPRAAPMERAFELSRLPAMRQWLAVLKFDGTESPIGALSRALRSGPCSRIYALGGRYDPELAQALSVLDAPWRYWLAEPLPGGAQRRAAAMGREDIPEFLYRHLVEEI